MSRNREFVFAICILLFTITGFLCCCYIIPLMCQQVRHRQKIIPIKEESKKEEEPQDIIINPMNFVIII
jgi:hypothetical protein